jgi:hypothetical protein
MADSPLPGLDASDPAEVSPAPLPDLSAVFAEARRRRADEEQEKAATDAAKQEEFMARLQRLKGGRAFRPGDPTGAKCTTCGRDYVYDDSLRIVHAPGECAPKSVAVAAQPIDLMAGVRRAYDPNEDED